MFPLRNTHAILTGASRGLGPILAHRLAKEGVNLTLVARDRKALEQLAAQLPHIQTKVISADLSDPSELARISQEALGPADLLINNAGVDVLGYFPSLPAEQISKALAVNLHTPILLTQAVLPGMLERKRGFIVNVASLAGLIGGAHAEVYNATKHGLVGFTRGLRASLGGTGVGATALCPGFISDVGMYADMRQEVEAYKPHWLLGTISPHTVAETMIRAIQKNLPEPVIAGGPPMRPVLALQSLFPRIAEQAADSLGLAKALSPVAQSRKST